ncbi:MAG: tRNA (cmo5U34)-methyltransferase [Pirellulaceae bacterium]
MTSSIAIHHIESNDKQRLLRGIYAWFRDGGVFAYSDQFSGATSDLYSKHMEIWHRAALKLGATEDDWKVWMQHQEAADFHETIANQID